MQNRHPPISIIYICHEMLFVYCTEDNSSSLRWVYLRGNRPNLESFRNVLSYSYNSLSKKNVTRSRIRRSAIMLLFSPFSVYSNVHAG